MITAKEIYSATNFGLDIILYYYPQAEDCVDNKKKFKRRIDEDDASACLKKYGDCYKVTDFGDQGTAMSPIDICMYEEGINFPEAIALLGGRYQVTDELKRSVNKPDIRKRQATDDEKEGARFFELEERFTDEQLKVLGPRVKEDHVNALNWHVAKCVSYVKNREVISKYTTPTYPIFMRECIINDSSDPDKVDKFYKIYEPLNPEKQWRFSYTPEGKKPKEYINGFHELKKFYAKYNADEEAIFKKDPANAEKPYKEKKISEAFICSGERDSLCVRSLGYMPLWFNSETYKVTPEEIKDIKKYVDVIYNIPDIDSTGRAKGTELALRFLDIHTIWLPSWLSHYRDQRGKPRKDFRDYCELRPKNEDFRNLMRLAMPAQFWTETYNDRTKKKGFDIDTDCLHYFLTLNGFYTLKDDNSDNTRYIRIEGNKVSQIKTKDIAKFLNSFVRERFLQREIRNLVLNSQRLSESSLERLSEVELDFTNYTPTSQYMFFNNITWQVSAKGIEEIPSKIASNGRYVWDTNLINHKVSVLKPMFEYEVGKNAMDEDVFDIEIKENNSNIFKYLINTSRIYWRKEFEYAWEDKDNSEMTTYKSEHRFDIAGSLLSKEEIKEQKMNLLNKIFAIGYNLHRYKSPSRAWALYAMDNKIGDDDECNGRSGKSFLFNTFAYFMRTVRLSGRNPKLMDNPHVFDQINQHSDFVLVDDCDKYLQTGLFYDSITGGMTINPKNNKSFYIDFVDAPKFGFTTNYVPRDFDPSTNARLLYMVFSDYYHEAAAENDYSCSWSIRDDFNKNLLAADYSEDEWNADINFFAQCLSFYLSVVDKGIKIQPPMENILRRKYKSDMGSNFEDWAYSYFAEESDHVNAFIVREEAKNNFMAYSSVKNCTMQKFTKALNGFAKLCPYVIALNPAILTSSSGRIQRKVDGETKDMIYLQTKEDINIDEISQNNRDSLPFPPRSEDKGLFVPETDNTFN
ncbi:hypothetical protein [Phocaeicola paurosaccharolyticus]|uniref:hypothetical protein n=1 Tax=Phocaeicola paurosaccharolyticus TaxID=732242 RepID=UPI002FE221BA